MTSGGGVRKLKIFIPFDKNFWHIPNNFYINTYFSFFFFFSLFLFSSGLIQDLINDLPFLMFLLFGHLLSSFLLFLHFFNLVLFGHRIVVISFFLVIRSGKVIISKLSREFIFFYLLVRFLLLERISLSSSKISSYRLSFDFKFVSSNSPS